MNVKVLSNLITSAYSCKNLMQHGKKRHLIKSLFVKPAKEEVKHEKTKISFAIGFKKVRLICFDSQTPTDTVKSKSKVQREILSRTIQDFESDQIQFRPQSLIIAECAF